MNTNRSLAHADPDTHRGQGVQLGNYIWCPNYNDFIDAECCNRGWSGVYERGVCRMGNDGVHLPKLTFNACKRRSLYNANGLTLQDGEVVKRAMHNSPLDLGAINDYFNAYELDVAISFHLNTDGC